MTRVTDFSDSLITISWDDWHKLPADTRQKLELYAYKAQSVGNHLKVLIPTYRLKELGMSAKELSSAESASNSPNTEEK